MTINTTVRTAGPFTGNGVATGGSFGFKLFAPTEMTVVQTTDLGVDSTLVYGTGFNVTLNADQNASPGGTINYLIAGVGPSIIPTNYKLNATSAVANLQTVKLNNNGGFFPAVINDALDRLTILVQQALALISRSIQFPLSDVGISTLLPNAATRASKILGFDAAGNISLTTDVASQVAIAVAAANTAVAAAATATAAVASTSNFWCGTAAGTANALTLTPTPAITSNTAGQKFRFVVNSTNTGSTIATVSGQASLSIKKSIGGALVALAQGDLPAGTIAEIENVDGTNLQLINVRPFNQGADVASAATIVLDTTTGDYVNITGTTNITAITLAQGQQRTIKFAGILTFTNGASLILPGGANIITAAGDVAILRGEAAGVVRCVAYTKASGTSVVAAAASGGSFKNLIIGGDFTKNPWQRGTPITSAANNAYTADRFLWTFVGAGIVDFIKATDAPTIVQAGAYCQHCLHVDTTTIDASIAATDTYTVRQKVEGLNASHLGFGQTGAVSVTLSFWHKHTKTGVYCVAIKNNANDRSYVVEYSQVTTNTWELATITIPGDTAGTWLYDNTVGLDLHFTIAAGSNFQTAAGAWTAGSFHATANQVNGLDTVTNDFKLALIQLEAGTSASAFENLPEDVTLQRCLRYYWRTTMTAGAGFFAHGIGQTATAGQVQGRYPVVMRAKPTLETTGTAGDYQMVLGNTGVTCNSVPSLQGDSTTSFFDLAVGTASGMADKGPLQLSNISLTAYLGFKAEL